MKMLLRIRTITLGAAIVAFTASLAHAQATRTWVSGVGDDANPCSRTAPCKTFAGAISRTAAGGFIDVLDPGGFGAVTITKSITIDGSGGPLAGVLASGVNGININSATAIVHLRNLSIESPKPGSPSPQGVNGVEVFAASQVHIQKCVIAGFSNAAVTFHPVSGSLFISDTQIMNNTNGGIAIATGRATIENLHATGNGNAVVVTGAAIVTVRNSFAGGSSIGYAAIVNAAAVLNLENVVATNNSTGVQVNSGATARLSNSTIVSNSVNGLQNDGISFIVSLSGNSVFGNPNNGAFTSTQVKQ
jgi:Periplasmic copper-binding protein (NosD)